MKNALSTYTVSKLLGVAIASVAKWIDDGQLEAGRTPGGHRRVGKRELIDFLRRHNLPIPPELFDNPPRVLIVDDDDVVRKWIAEEIKARHPDYEVLEASDGFAAGELITSSKPDAVILDIRMPGMDGFQICTRIKSKESTKDIVVIAITAHPSKDSEQRILDAGAKAFFTKPFDADTLLDELEAEIIHRV